MFPSLKIFFDSKNEFTYTGDELRPHFNYLENGLQGTSLWIACGPCEVETNELVDLQDQSEGEFIRSKKMIHFLGEFFGFGIKEGVFLQSVFISIFKDVLNEELHGEGTRIIQKGNDLFYENKKLSVSIVTISPVSLLMHFGVNIDSAGAPVSAVGLKDLKLEEEEVIQKFISRWEKEWQRLSFACTKVRPVL